MFTLEFKVGVKTQSHKLKLNHRHHTIHVKSCNSILFLPHIKTITFSGGLFALRLNDLKPSVTSRHSLAG